MTPEERNLVIELFDRLGTLEDARRDPDAERVINDGLRQAPNAVYALVQTTLVQDEALKRADARIKELEAHGEDAPRDASFLGGMRQQVGSRGGSVPSVRASASPGGMSPAWQAAAQPSAAQPSAAAQPQAAAPAAPSGFGGSSFLGTAAAAAAGMIGGSLLLSGIRSMMGGSGGAGGHGALDSLAGGSGGGSPWASGGGANSDLARAAGIDDIGRTPAGNDSNRAGLLGSGDAGAGDDSGADADAFLGDADTDLGGGGDN